VASAGSVTVDFDARSAKFAAELEKVESRLGRLEGKVGSVTDGLKLLAKVLSVGVVLNYAKAMFEAADDIGDAAARSGVAVESLSRLKFVAEQSDVEFGALTIGIKKFQQSLSEANIGTASAVKSFAELGIEAGTIRNLALEQQLGVIADGFQNILNPADQTRIAIELFGKAGQDLIPFLNLGSAGIKELADEADRLGITLSGPAVAGIGAADQAFKKLSATIAGFAQNRLGDLALGILGTDFLPQLDQANIKLQRLLEEKQRIELSGAPEGSGFAARLREIQVEAGAAAAAVARLTEQASSDQSAKDARRKLLDDIAEFKRGTVDLEKQLNAKQAAVKPIEQQATGADFRRPSQESFALQIGDPLDRFKLEEVATQEHLDKLLDKYGDFSELRFEQESGLSGALSALRQEFGIEEINFEELKSATIQDIQTSLALSGLQIATALFGQNKKVALAVAAINIGVGATEALKLPFPANLAAVAKVLAQGAQLTQRIRSASIGGGGGFGGSSVGGVSQTTGTENRPDVAGLSERAATTVYINGVVDKRVIDQLVGALRDEIDRDVVIIPGNSRQAIELRGG